MKLSALLLFAPSLFAQLNSPNEAGVAMGHLHLVVKDVQAQKKFWVGTLGLAPVKLADMEGARLPGAIILFKAGSPAGGTIGSAVGHVGLKVRDLKAVLDKCKSNGVKIVSEAPPRAMVMAPDDVQVELTEDTTLTVPAVNHHIHFYNSAVLETQAWYAKTFGAKPGKRGPFEAADVPGVNLTFSAAEAATAPTKGRALDHIGFEVVNLEAFAKKLAESGVHFDLPYRKIPALGLSIAFFTDPWGVYIELTEGLDQAAKPL